jgi:hypothetical protein
VELAKDERKLADGEVVWSWRPDAGAKLAKTLLASLRVMVAKEPGHQGEREVSRNPTAQGRPDCLR